MAANNSGMTLTSAGHELLALALAGNELHFTRAMIGDGVLPDGTEITELTALISPKQTLEIQSISTSKIGTCEVVVEVSNKGLAMGYFVREYGVFARHPQTGQEILYSYANKGDKCSYLEGENGVYLINYALSLITVIHDAPNITAEINNSTAYVTTTKLDARFINLYAEGVTPAGFWTFSPTGDDRLRPLSVDDAKLLILGTHDIAALNARVSRLEDNLAQVLLSQEMQELYPQYSHYIIEDFKNVNQIDVFSAKITSIIAGDDSVDCSPVEGMLPGSWYTITDGINSENVQVLSINIENGIQRVIFTEPVKNTYILEYCRLYRTSANIATETATGTKARNAFSWRPAFEWRGQGAAETFTVKLNTGISDTKAFTMSGNITIDSDGFITLE